MTVSSTTTQVTVLGNGSTTTFSYSFCILDSTDCYLVYTDATGAETVLPTSAWVISGPGFDSSGGFFTYPISGTPIATGTSLTLVRSTPIVQPGALPDQGPAFPSLVEAELDRLTLELQEIAFKVANIQTSTSTVIPPSTVTPAPYDQIISLGNQTDTISTGTNIITLVVGRAHTITACIGSVVTASSSGGVQYNVQKNGTSILTGVLCNVDAGQTNSLTSASPTVINGGSVSVSPGDILTFSITASGVGAVGPMVQLLGTA